MKLLLEEEYLVSHKADGTRYMMWIDSPGKVYFIGRNSDVFQVIRPLNFPTFYVSWDHLFETLLDGVSVYKIAYTNNNSLVFISKIEFTCIQTGDDCLEQHRHDVTGNQVYDI